MKRLEMNKLPEQSGVASIPTAAGVLTQMRRRRLITANYFLSQSRRERHTNTKFISHSVLNIIEITHSPRRRNQEAAQLELQAL